MNSSSLMLSRLTINGLSRILSRRWYSKEEWRDESIDITLVDDTPKYGDFVTEEEEQEILRKRNKSGLSQFDRNRLNGKKPHDQNWEWYHNTIKYKQRMLGRYGVDALDVPVGCVWPTKENLQDMLEFEKTAYPKTLWEMWEIIDEKNKKNAEEMIKREKEIETKLAKVETWRKELEAKIAKKEEDARKIKERKDRLIAEVRRTVGFDMDPRDERFKQLVEQKEKEDKKRKKEMRKQAFASRFLDNMIAKSNAMTADAQTEKKPSDAESPKTEAN